MAAVLKALSAHLRAGAVRPFAWGECDCCSWVCAWIAARRGVDPMASWRGTYRTCLGAARNIHRGGGMLTVVCRAMAAAGLVPTEDPQPGDVALVKTAQGEALAIRTPTGFACKAPAGIVVAHFPVLAAWSVV